MSKQHPAADRPGLAAGAMALASAGLIAVFFWLMVGDLGLAIRERSALPAGLELLRRNGASDTITSLLLSTVPAVLSLLLVPFVGYHSDRYRSRWGRRRPFLLAVAPVGAAAMIGLALSPALGEWTHGALGKLSPGLRAVKLSYFCVFWTAFECSAITTLALFTGLVNDIVPKGLLGRFYASLRIVGLSVGIAFNTWVFALLDHHLYDILIGIGLLFSIPVVLMCVMIREAPHPDGEHRAPSPARRSYMVPRAHILECFAQRHMLWIFAAFMLAYVTFSPFITFCQYYAEASGISKASLGTMTAYGYAFSIVSAFGVGTLVDRYGAVRVSSILMGAYLLAASTGYFLLNDAFTFRLFYVAHVVISGAYFTAAASMPMALFPRLQFVQFNSTKDLMAALLGILVSSVQGPVLDLSGHDYRLTLLSGTVFSLLCLVCLIRVQANSRTIATPPLPDKTA